MRRAMMVPSTSISSTASSASFVQNLVSERNSPRQDEREGEGVNAADDTMLDSPPAESPRSGQREQTQTPVKHESEPGLDREVNLGDRHIGTPRNPRTRSVTGESHKSEERIADEERLKRSRDEWDALQGQSCNDQCDRKGPKNTHRRKTGETGRSEENQ